MTFFENLDYNIFDYLKVFLIIGEVSFTKDHDEKK
jgi:hypothetical protein